MEEEKPDLAELIKAMNKYFGEGKISGAVFFENNPDGTLKGMSPIFQPSNLENPKPGQMIQEIVGTLKTWSHALNHMAEDMVKKTLPKN